MIRDPVGSGFSMMVRAAGGVQKTRTSYQLLGLGLPRKFGVHNNSLVNLRRGLVERVFNVEGPDGLQRPPLPGQGVISRRLSPFLSALRPHLPKTAPSTAEEFVECYKGDRRWRVYENARLSLLLRPVDRRDAQLKTFVKAEKIDFTAKPDPAPRVIQPRDPRYNLEVGRFLKKLEHQIFDAISAVNDGVPVVMKGHNAHGTAKWLRHKWDMFRKPVAVGLDASRFDQHVSLDALKWEHSVYLDCFKGQDRVELARLLRWQLRNKGVGVATDGQIKYTVEGCRMSGDMNTGLGNCLLMCAMVYAYCSEKGIAHQLANNGDDCVVIMESRDLAKFMDGLQLWFLEMGFTMKVEDPVNIFEKVEFCQTQPVWDGERWVMTRNPWKCIPKDLMTFLDVNRPKVAQGWMAAIGECGLSLSGGLPVLQEFYRALLRNGQIGGISKHPALESGFFRLARGMARSYRSVGACARVSFWEAFGILPSTQEQIEDYYSRVEISTKVTQREIIEADYSILPEAI